VKIILTNDDGIDAPGLQILNRCVQDVGDVIIVAPAEPQSGIGHRVSVRVPIGVQELQTGVYRVEGTPADCSRIALKHLVPDADYLIAGINPGANLGSDVYNSGTVAAAREASILGCRSIAISQYIARDEQIDWDATGYQAEPVLKMLISRKLSDAHFWNVNLPHPLHKGAEQAFKFCGLDTNPHKYEYTKNGDEYSYHGSIHERPRDPGTDVAVCFDEGKISITQIAVGTTKLV
jgi:5'-nucleotidase